MDTERAKRSIDQGTRCFSRVTMVPIEPVEGETQFCGSIFLTFNTKRNHTDEFALIFQLGGEIDLFTRPLLLLFQPALYHVVSDFCRIRTPALKAANLWIRRVLMNVGEVSLRQFAKQQSFGVEGEPAMHLGMLAQHQDTIKAWCPYFSQILTKWRPTSPDCGGRTTIKRGCRQPRESYDCA